MPQDPNDQQELKLVTANTVLHNGPCFVSGVTLAADGQNCDAQIYDGINTNGEEKIHLEALTGTSFKWGPHPRVKFNNGIYVVVSRAEAHVMVTYIPLERHE